MFTNNKISKSIRIALAFGAASTLAFAGSASAQEEDEEEVRSERPERIQVVGSRIRTDGLDSATPIDIISAEIATEQGLNTLGELLRTSTIASGSNQLISAMSVGSVTAGGAGNESISMRGLGSNRTLVLLNGRRAGPSGTRGQVAAFDMNALPISAVERVEILKDGASSLYGSDAVAGVINIITKRGDESSINVSGNQPLERGGETFRINGTWGTTFDRGSFRAVADYNVQTELQRGDRDHFACGQRYMFDPATGEQVDPIDPRTGNIHCNDLPYGMWLWNAGASNFTSRITSFDYSGYNRANGTPTYTQTQPGDISAPDGWFPVGYSRETDALLDTQHPFQDLQTMVPETKTASVYFQGDYDLTNNISMYAELMHSRRETSIDSYRQFWMDPMLNPLGSWGLVDGWDGDVWIDPTAITDHSGSVTTVDYTRAVLGLEGAIGYWNWDISYQRSLNSGEYQQKVILEDALDMGAELGIYAPDACAGSITPISGRECHLIPFFTPEYIYGDFDQGTRDFLFDTETGKTIYKQDTVDAYVTGDLIDLPAGPLGAAFGVSYQSDEIQDTPGEVTLAGNSWGMTSAGITAGKSNTKAVYGEVQAPLLRDLPFVESLDLTASARYTDVSTYGSGETFKVSANWNIANGFRIRASRGTSFRSPALFELFLKDQTSFFDQRNDPCFNWGQADEAGTLNAIVRANCIADGIPEDYNQDFGSATAITAGGAGRLDAETSVSEGIGLVWASEDNRFAASVDYYDVIIRDQVSNIGGSSIVNLCYSSENFATEPFCEQFDRNDGTNGNYNITEVRGGYVNVAEQTVRGADVVLTYMDETPYGSLRVRLDHTIQFERIFRQFPDSAEINSIGRLGNPKHSGTLNVGLVRDSVSFNYAIRYVGKVSNDSLYANGPFTTYRGEEVRVVASGPTTLYHTLSVNKSFDDGVDLTVGVRNLFDKKPPSASRLGSRASVVGNAMLYSQYDQIGRSVFLNLGYTF
ncbi:outer membrane receptor for ferrienterochelin and colicin [Idiomarina sp. A28L]|uniref:TonB-dependent receptor plug domain-containing protein n=1 Tax=Idiomarina sp. A28L TaxID=1036674 RepID=UPI0002138923|nr:TonB-dependent receptor [Idiomarina sp. A28L]EGN74948.1 outer membrane receptor for ferrienterochelin and colicin [Idiomarina sp. A28L]